MFGQNEAKTLKHGSRTENPYAKDPEAIYDRYLGQYENFKEVRKEKVLHDKKQSKANVLADRGAFNPLKIIAADATEEYVQQPVSQPKEEETIDEPAAEEKTPSENKGI